MKVKIDGKKKMFLESDTYGYVIKKYSGKTDNQGNETYTSLTHPSSIERAIKWLYKQRINESTATTLKELLDDHKQIMKEVHELFEVEGLK